MDSTVNWLNLSTKTKGEENTTWDVIYLLTKNGNKTCVINPKLALVMQRQCANSISETQCKMAKK